MINSTQGYFLQTQNWNKEENKTVVDMLSANCGEQEGIKRNYRLKPYWGNPNVRNFRGGGGNRVMVNLNINRHETGNGGYSQGEPKTTTPLLYSTKTVSRCQKEPMMNSGEPIQSAQIVLSSL